MPGDSSVLQIGEWAVNPALDTIARAGETLKLEPRTMRLLICLADSPGAVVSVDRLLNEVWPGVVVGSASVYQAVSQLRRLLGDVGTEPTYIANIPRKGYRLIAAVRRTELAVATPPSADAPPGPDSPPGLGPPVTTPTTLAKRGGSRLFLGVLTLVAILAAAVPLWMHRGTADRPDSAGPSIVVLPFVDMTEDKAEQSFCDGLTEELSAWLSQIPTLRVVARTSAFAFRGQDEDVRKIGKALDTDHILEGSMRRSGNHLRVTVQLIDARNGYHIWSESFDRPMEDAINIQEDISRSVAGVLKVRLTSESDRQFAARRTADPQAFQLYLLGRHYAQQLTAESTDRAITLFRQVLAADPKFAPSYVSLAYAVLNRGYFHDLPIADVALEMEPLIAAALRLDDHLAAAYAVRGALRAAQSRVQDGMADLQRAIALNPNDMGAWAEIGRIRLTDGKPRDALASYDRAAALDPLNHTLQEQRCVALEDMARYDDAARACERARVLQPGITAPAEATSWLAESRGRIDDALQWNAVALHTEPSDFSLYWKRATLFLALGRAVDARQAVELGRTAAHEDEDAAIALVRVVYCEQGADALRAYLGTSNLEQSPHAVDLFEAAYARLVIGDVGAVKQLIGRAEAAPDLLTGYGESPWYARGYGAIEPSYRIDRAAAELALGDRVAAQRDLHQVLEMLDAMIAGGVERHATYELRARVHALDGDADAAMRDLGTAAKLGWRRGWWARHEPYFASLQPRADFQALLADVAQSNEQLEKTLKTDR